MLVHGVQATLMRKQRWEADPERNLALFAILPDMLLLRILGGAVIGTGLLLTYSQSLWGRGWIWLSLALFVGLWLAMRRYGTAFYVLIESTAKRALEARGTPDEPATAKAFADARHAWHPIGVTAGSVVVMGLILWLMIFKPF
jgi:hypothetical protein